MRIAITGCSGSVGKRVLSLALKRGHTIIGIDQAPAPQVEASQAHQFTFVSADARDHTALLEAFRGCEAVIHLVGMRNPEKFEVETHNSNVVISWNVLRVCAELGITRIAQASSVNVIPLVYSVEPTFEYFPIDEMHPCLPDEPYGLSKVICELQADTIVRRHPSTRIASLRLHWSIPGISEATGVDAKWARDALWGYVQEDSVADAFLLAITKEDGKWTGHEAFYIVAPITIMEEESLILKEKHWPAVPIKTPGALAGRKGFFNCDKAEKLLGWVHRDGVEA